MKIKTISAGLENSVKPDTKDELKNRLLPFIRTMNQIRTLSYQFANFHFIRCFEEGIRIPKIDKNIFAQWSRCVSTGSKVFSKDPQVLKSAKQFNMLRSSLTMPTTNGVVNQAMTFVGTEYVTSLKNNIMMHYEQHLDKILKHVVDPKNALTGKEQWEKVKQRRTSMNKNQDPILSSFLINNCLEETRKKAKKKPLDVLLCFWKMNQYCAVNNIKQFQVFPLAKHFSDAHITIDSKVFGLIMGKYFNYYEQAKIIKKRNRNDEESEEKSKELEYAEQIWRPIDQQSKRTIFMTNLWNEYFILPRHNPSKKRFSGSITTNGVEIGFYFVSPEKEEEFEEPKKPVQIGKCGLYVEGKVILTKDMNIVGIDPGYINLITATNDEGGKTKKNRNLLTVTSSGRNVEIGEVERRRILEQAKKKRNISELEQLVPSCKFSCLDDIKKYIQGRGLIETKLIKFYNRTYWRKLKWRNKRKRQHWRDDLVCKLKKKFDQPGKQTVLAWGMGTQNSHHLKIKGSPPGPQKAIRSYVAKFMPVICTSEYNTTKNCSICGGETEPMKGPESRKKFEKRNKEGQVRDMNAKVHGIRCCSNNHENDDHKMHHLSRDYNAAVNIRQRCLSINLQIKKAKSLV